MKLKLTPPHLKHPRYAYSLFCMFSSIFIVTHLAQAQPTNSQEFLVCGSEGGTAPDTTSWPENNTFICSDINEIKYLRVAIHFILPGGIITKTVDDCTEPPIPIAYTGFGNFTETGDGFINGNYNGFMRADDIINESNYMLENNKNQWRKATDPNVQNPPDPNVTYPVDPPIVPMRYLLTGVYFHRDYNAYYGIKSRSAIYNEYAVEKTNTINVFYRQNPNDNFTGVANGFGGPTKYVFNNEYDKYIQPTCRDWSISFAGQNLNHEIGHTVSLHHTWNEDDNCLDTPLGYLHDKWNVETMVCTLNQRANC